MRKNKEIIDGTEYIVEYDQIDHPITHEMIELPVTTTNIETGEVADITYSQYEGKLKKIESKRENVTLDKIWKKLSDIEGKLDLLLLHKDVEGK